MNNLNNKVSKLDKDLKRNPETISYNKNNKNYHNVLIPKNNKIAEVSSKHTRDIKQKEISVEKLNVNENGVPKIKINHLNSSLFKYIQLEIETLNIENEKLVAKIHNQSELLDYLNKENYEINENYKFFEELIQENSLKVNKDISDIDEKLKIIDDELEDINKFHDQEEQDILNNLNNEIEKMVEQTKKKYVISLKIYILILKKYRPSLVNIKIF